MLYMYIHVCAIRSVHACKCVRTKIDTLVGTLRDEKERFAARKEKRDKNRIGKKRKEKKEKEKKRRATNARAWW